MSFLNNCCRCCCCARKPLHGEITAKVAPKKAVYEGSESDFQREINDLGIESRFPEQFHCPRCNQEWTTKTEYVMGCYAWCMVFALLLVGFVLFWTPFYCDFCKDVQHTCPECGLKVGRHEQEAGQRA